MRGIFDGKNFMAITLYLPQIIKIFIFNANWGNLNKVVDK